MEREKMTALVQAVQQGKPDAAGELYTAFYRDIYYFIYKTVQDASLAEDLTQDTFLEILETIHKLQEPAAFVTWSRQIAYHRCTGYFKKRRELLADEDEDGTTVFDTMAEDRGEYIPDEALNQQELRRTIQSMVNSLPEEQRSAIVLRYFEELPVKDIARIQGVSEGTVKSRLNYGRRAIQGSVERWERSSGVKLRCVGILPLLLWLFRYVRRARNVSKLRKLMPEVSLEAVSAGAGAKGAARVSGAAASGAKAGTGTAKAGFFSGLGVKIAAVAAAAALTVGGIAIASGMLDPDSDTGRSNDHQEQEDDRQDEAPGGGLSNPEKELLENYYGVVQELQVYEQQLYEQIYYTGFGMLYGDQEGTYTAEELEAYPYIGYNEHLKNCYDTLLELEEVDGMLADTEMLQREFPELVGVPDRQTLLSRFALLEDVRIATSVTMYVEDETESIVEDGTESVVEAVYYDASGKVICGKLPSISTSSIGFANYCVSGEEPPYWDDANVIPYTGLFGETVYLFGEGENDYFEGGKWSYTFDNAGKLTQAVFRNHTQTVYTLTYDAQGRLVREDATFGDYWENLGEYVGHRNCEYIYGEDGRLAAVESMAIFNSEIDSYYDETEDKWIIYGATVENERTSVTIVSCDEKGRPVRVDVEGSHRHESRKDPSDSYVYSGTTSYTVYYGDCIGYTPGLLYNPEGPEVW